MSEASFCWYEPGLVVSEIIRNGLGYSHAAPIISVHGVPPPKTPGKGQEKGWVGGKQTNTNPFPCRTK